MKILSLIALVGSLAAALVCGIGGVRRLQHALRLVAALPAELARRRSRNCRKHGKIR